MLAWRRRRRASIEPARGQSSPWRSSSGLYPVTAPAGMGGVPLAFPLKWSRVSGQAPEIKGRSRVSAVTR